jgi:hypothetical protein
MTRCRAICIGLAAVISLISCSEPEVHEGDRLTSFSQEITSPIHEFQVKAGEAYTLDITTKNTGTQPWFGSTPTMSVRAGYRWHDSNGVVLPIEGNRAQLDHPELKPGDSARLKLIVVAPPTPGSYTLLVSMVQEGVKWFFEGGAKPLVLHVTVT